MQHLPVPPPTRAKAAKAALLALLLLPLFQTGCAVPFPPYERTHDAKLLAELEGRLPPTPPSGRMLQRCVLEVGGMELALTLHLLLGQPERMRAMALDDLGGTVFHFLHLGSETRVSKQPAFMPREFLAQGLVPELAVAFLSAKRGEAEAVRLGDGRPALLLALPERQALLWRGEDGEGEDFLDHVQLGRQGRSISRIRILEWARNGAGKGRGPVLYPSRIKVENDLYDYSMDIRVVQWEAGSLDPRLFQADPRSPGEDSDKK